MCRAERLAGAWIIHRCASAARRALLGLLTSGKPVIDVDDSRFVTLHKVFATGRFSGIGTIRELGGVIELRDGLVVKQWIYLDRDEAPAAAVVTR